VSCVWRILRRGGSGWRFLGRARPRNVLLVRRDVSRAMAREMSTDQGIFSGESRILRAARALPVGTLRPAIVLYDEPHPHGDAIGDLQSYDLSRSPDLLLIMGTSLKVHGLKRLVKEFAKAVHAKKGSVIFVNATSPSREWEGVIDVHVHGETDRWVEMVEEEWRRFRPQDWETQTLLDGDVISTIAKGKAKAKGQLKCRGNPNLMLMDRSTGRIEQGEHPARARAIADCSLFPISPQIIPQLLPPLLPPLIARRPARQVKQECSENNNRQCRTAYTTFTEQATGQRRFRYS